MYGVYGRCQRLYSKRKLFIFHNKKAVTHIESQHNQSSYIENLVLNNINKEQNIYHLLNEIKQQLNPSFKMKNEEIDNSVSSSIMDILTFK